MKPGDLVVQAKHWPEGYVFSVVSVDDEAGTVEAEALDPKTLEAASVPTYDDVHIEVNGQRAYDRDGNPITRPGSEYDGDTPSGTRLVGRYTLLANTLAPYEEG